MVLIDIAVGQRFGQLTVLGRDPRPPRKETSWLCRCDCGNEKSVASSFLRTRARSCGHPQPITFGKWDQLTLSYAAGFLDGEGCFSVERRWKIRVGCSNTHRPTIEWFAATFGGNFTPEIRKKKSQWRPTFQWTVVSRDAERLCRAIAPYLNEKAPQALALIAIRQTMSSPLIGGRVDPEIAAERDRLATILKGYKRVAWT